MTQNDTCPTCSTPLATSGPARGSCPRCLLGLGLDDGDLVQTGLGATREPPPTVEELASAFPDLEIEELLGSGGMGSVYRARQRKLDRTVALKILHPEIARHPEFAERFQREARALAALSHPGIVSVHDCGRAGDWYYLLMEFVDGANLRHLLRTGRLSSKEALELVGQVSTALQYAHDHGVVHRDIKPENILVDTRGQAKIADFGLAKLHQPGRIDLSLTGTAQSMGTMHYMAPEQVETPREVDHRADIYSLGVVFYEILTGELPLGRFRKPSEKVELDVRVDEIVLRSLAKEPQLRYQAAGDVRTDVEALRHAAAPPPPPGPRTDAAAKLHTSDGGAALEVDVAKAVKKALAGGDSESSKKGSPGCLKILVVFLVACLFCLCVGGSAALLLAGRVAPELASTLEPFTALKDVENAPAPLPPAEGSMPSGLKAESQVIVLEDGDPVLSAAFRLETGVAPDVADRIEAFLGGFFGDYEKLLRAHMDSVEFSEDGVSLRVQEFEAERRALLEKCRRVFPGLLGQALWETHGGAFEMAPYFCLGDKAAGVKIHPLPGTAVWSFAVEVQTENRTDITRYDELPVAFELLQQIAAR